MSFCSKRINIGTNSFDIKDNNLDKSFEITFKNPQDEEDAKEILRTHKGIDQLKEILRQIIRKELKK